jgi:hypothetical protein
MYASFDPQDDLVQGDIVDHVVLTYLSDISKPSLYDVHGDEVDIDLSQPLDLQQDVKGLGQVVKSRVLILSQSCDVLRRPYLCVARIFSLEVYDSQYRAKTSPKKRAEHLQQQYQRVGVQPTAFYLQESLERGFLKSVASFLELHSIKNTPENVQYLKRNRLLRLNSEAVEDLQFRIGYFFGRFATTDDYMLTDEEKRWVRG